MNQLRLRHRNGGGAKWGNDAEVDSQSFLHRTSSVGDSAEVHGSIIDEGCLIADSAQVVNAHLTRTSVTGNARITGTGTHPVSISDSDVSGETRVWGGPSIQGVRLHNARVFGNAVLVGEWEITDYLRVHAGYWLSPPRHALIEGPNVDTIISECEGDNFHIGCWCLPRETWFRKGYRQRLGKVSGWTPEQIEFTYDSFASWARS